MVWHITQKYFQTASLSFLFYLMKWFYIILIAIILFHHFKISLLIYTIFVYYVDWKSCFSFFWLDDFMSAYKWSSHTYRPDQTSYCFLFDMIYINVWLHFNHCDKTRKRGIDSMNLQPNVNWINVRYKFINNSFKVHTSTIILE